MIAYLKALWRDLKNAHVNHLMQEGTPAQKDTLHAKMWVTWSDEMLEEVAARERALREQGFMKQEWHPFILDVTEAEIARRRRAT
jgi:hypothetical protein